MELSSIQKDSAAYSSNALSKELLVENKKSSRILDLYPKLKKAGHSTQSNPEIKGCEERK
jgi:hypothetical protein